jgi:hypothetical protein
VLGHGFRSHEIHLQGCEWESDLVVLGLRVEVTLDAVVDEGDEACGDDDTGFC